VLTERREQERPCTRCIKRNIGHLCHDEPRDQELKKSKSLLAASSVADSDTQSDLGRPSMDQNQPSMGPPAFDTSMSTQPGNAAKTVFDPATLGAPTPLQLVQPTPVSSIQANALSSTMGQCRSFDPPSRCIFPSEAEAGIRSPRFS